MFATCTIFDKRDGRLLCSCPCATYDDACLVAATQKEIGVAWNGNGLVKCWENTVPMKDADGRKLLFGKRKKK
jgi:hypothetical protein